MLEQPNAEEKWPSYTMVEPRMRKIYFQFYQETTRRRSWIERRRNSSR
jgi:hypothetical protein